MKIYTKHIFLFAADRDKARITQLIENDNLIQLTIKERRKL